MKCFFVSVPKDYGLGGEGGSFYFSRCRISYSYSSDLLSYIGFLQFYDCLAYALQLTSLDFVCSTQSDGKLKGHYRSLRGDSLITLIEKV